MSTRPRSALLRHLLVSTTALAVAGAGLMLVAPAQAAAQHDAGHDVTMTWGFSNASHGWGITTAGDVGAVNPTTATSTYDGGTETFTKADGVTLTDGHGTLADDGTGTVDFTGSVTYSPFAQYGSMVADKSTVTFADFELDVVSPTEGELSAAVSYHKPEGDLPATRVAVATFDISSLTVTEAGVTLETAAPDWAGAVAEGTYAPGYSDAWPTALVDTLRTVVSTPANQDLSIFFFRTGNTAGNDAKAPLALTAEAVPAPSVETALSYGAGSVTVDLAGDHFTSTDGNPGDDGIYVGLAPAGGLPDVSSQDAMDNFAAATWVSGASIDEGAFTSSLTAKGADLERGTAYAIYTWRAHGHSTTSQDTETPVSITWSKLAAPSTVTAALAAKPTPKKGGKLAVTVSGKAGKATGTVTVRLSKQGKAGPTRSAGLQGGKATVKLPRLPRGAWKAVVTYAGSDAYRTSKDTLTFRVR